MTFRLAIAALVTALATLYSAGCTSHSTRLDLGDSLEITGELPFTKVFNIKAVTPGDPNSATEIEWYPVYTIANLGDESIELRDVTPNFPVARSKRDGRPVELSQIRPTQMIDVYRTDDELWKRRPSETKPPPIALSPGSRISIRLHQEFEVRHDGKPYWNIRPGDNLANYLGPFFGLEQLSTGEFRCVGRTELNLTISTSVGNVQMRAEQVLCIAGAVVIVPPPPSSSR